MSVSDKILARVPSEGSPVKRYLCPLRSQCGFSTSVWSGSHAPVPIDRRARINFSLSSFDLIKTQGCYQTDLYSSCYLGFTQKSPLWPMATELCCLVKAAHLYAGGETYANVTLKLSMTHGSPQADNQQNKGHIREHWLVTPQHQQEGINGPAKLAGCHHGPSWVKGLTVQRCPATGWQTMDK